MERGRLRRLKIRNKIFGRSLQILTKLHEEQVLLDLIVVSDNCSHDDIGVSVDVFGDGVDDDVSSKRDGSLEVWRHKGVVDDYQDLRVGLLGGLDDCSDVDDFEERVGWRLEPDHLSVRLDGSIEILDLGEIDKVDLEPVVRDRDFADVSLGASVDVIGANDVISDLEEIDDSGGSGESGREHLAVLGVFESSQVLLEHVTSRVSGTGVVVSLGLSGLVLLVGGRETDWWDDLKSERSLSVSIQILTHLVHVPLLWLLSDVDSGGSEMWEGGHCATAKREDVWKMMIMIRKIYIEDSKAER